ncbi:hypothetical protein GON03_03560 [Nocardioides sp. MAH-18]|uniref:Uncharacterized protein n=1 Tax=Nocardioides agri TaxID=2682843 RepID=A0A6L6XRL0_9ACTN|nr:MULTISPECIES: hypothetical protein [unclassified Nocardioides]MBA2953377.1 hypothetical protein [Nocardioides sp. CGMCC 1.13656]MVQ48245.1 hypothetical protein [Nocardioides sp. MAH-18]
MLVLTRRTTLALGASGLMGVAACGAEREVAPAGAPQDATSDDALVDEVVAQITAVAAVAANVTRLIAMHAAHLTALDAAAPAVTTSAATGPEVRAAEREHQRYLVDAALRAESGPLARLLASMSAAVSQQLAVPGRLA